MGRRQCENGDRDRGTAHVDRRAERNRNGVGVLFEVEALAQREVDRDIGRRAAREKRGDATFPQRSNDDRIRIAPRLYPDDQRIHEQRHDQHAAQEDGQDPRVVSEYGQARLGEIAGNEPEDADRRKADHDTYDMRYRIGKVGEQGPRRFRGMMQKDPEQDAPHQDSDVVGAQHRIDRVVDQLQQQPAEHFGDALGRRGADLSNLQGERGGKQRAHRDRQQRRRHRADEVHQHDGP